MKLLKFTIVTYLLMLATACGSVTTVGNPGDIVTVPDISAATQSILPIMDSTDASAVVASISYTSIDFWNDPYPFQQMASTTFGTDPEYGSESIFYTISTMQTILDSIQADGGFDMPGDNCQSPDVAGLTGTSTAVADGQTITVPVLDDVDSSGFDCLINITEFPDSYAPIEGGSVDFVSYAFGRATASDGSYYVGKLIITASTNSGDNVDYSVLHVEYDQTTESLSVEQASFGDKDDNDFGIRLTYSGDAQVHDFIYSSTARADQNGCTGSGWSVNDGAKKIIGRGISQGDDSGFLMKLQQVCAQSESSMDEDPQYFCIDATTKEPTDDTSLCTDYEDPVENTTAIDADSVPFSIADFENDNVITIQ